MLHHIALARLMFALGILGLLVLAVSCMIRGKKLRSPGLYLLFILLAFFALDGGLVTLLTMISKVAMRMGRVWPDSTATVVACRAIPLVLPVVFGVLALWGLVRGRFPLRLTVAMAIVMPMAVMQGLARCPSISPRRITETFTSYPRNDLWAMIGFVALRMFVLIAIALVLWPSPRGKRTGEDEGARA